MKLTADKKKIIKKSSLGKSTRRKLCINQSGTWGINLRSNETKSILLEYIEGNFANDAKDLKNLTVQQKNEILILQFDLNRDSAQKFYASRRERYTVLRPNNQKIMILGTLHIYNFEVLVGKFYHERTNQNFLKDFKYKEETVLEKKKRYQHIVKEGFIFIQNKTGDFMKCQSMIFTYRKIFKNNVF